MFCHHDILGDRLPPQTLCLTFDDGPGPDSATIAAYLTSQGIAATFFVIGAHARAQPETIQHLRDGGHLVGNHTDSHPALVAFYRDGGDVVAEIARADAAISAPDPDGTPTFFRPPYGDWRDETGAGYSSVAAALNESGRFPHLIGPIGWDIDARDWHLWRAGCSVAEVGQAYLDAIEATGRGIVLLHDSAETEALRVGNRCLDLVRWLVPILRDLGYQFIRLDEVVTAEGIIPTGWADLIQDHESGIAETAE